METVTVVEKMATILRNFLRHYSARNRKCKNEASKSGHARLYRLLSLGVALPIIVALTGYVFATKKEEEEQEYVPYEYLNIRTKRFPWGDGNTTLFHNPRKNHIPQTEGSEENGVADNGEDGGNGNGEENGNEGKNGNGENGNEGENGQTEEKE